MNELIKIDTNKNQEPVVSGRDLHKELKIDTPYRLWFPRMCEYGFTENVDYTPYIFVHPKNQQEIIDHILKLDMAKEIAMIQRTEEGKKVRQYFIQVEKDFNSPEKIMARALKLAETQIGTLKLENNQQKELIEEQKPKALFADSVCASRTAILIGELAKILKQKDIEMGQNRLFEWLRSNNYLISRKGTDYNMPTQKSMDLKLFEIKETVITHSDGHTVINKTPKVTGKGQVYFVNKFKLIEEV